MDVMWVLRNYYFVWFASLVIGTKVSLFGFFDIWEFGLLELVDILML